MLTKLKTEAASRALKARVQFGFPLDTPCDIFELICKYGLSLRFTSVATMDGMYLSDGLAGSINVSALRPAGLQRFTAAHELGHFVFGHGARLDTDIEKMASSSNDETVADAFARHLLMPKRAVYKGFVNLGTTPEQAEPHHFHAVASWLGVGYTTLVQQTRWTLKLISPKKFHELTLRQPQQIKRAQVPSISWAGRKELWPLSSSWAGHKVHLQVGDVVTGLKTANLDYFDIGDQCLIARAPGHCELELFSGDVVSLNIARTDFVGMYQYRYLEEPEDA